MCMMMEQVTAHQHQLYQPPNVDAVYVDRGRSLLLELRAQDLLNQDSLHSTPLPSVVSADMALSSLFRRSKKPILHSMSQHSSPALTRTKRLTETVGGGAVGIKLSKSTSFDRIQGSDSEEEGEGEEDQVVFERRSHSMLHLKSSFRKRRKAQSHKMSSNLEQVLQKSRETRPPYL